MLTIVTAMPWEAGPFTSRLRRKRRAEIDKHSHAIRGFRGPVEVRVLISMPGEERVALAAEALSAMEPAATGILSVGSAGGLDPSLRPGDLVLASRIHHRRVLDGRGGRRGPPLAVDAAFRRWLKSGLEQSQIEHIDGDVLHTDGMLLRRTDKAQHFEQNGTAIVQMEDYLWAEYAAERGIPFASLRAVLDTAQTDLPPWVLAFAFTPPPIGRVAKQMLRRPHLLGAIPRLARQRRKAVKSVDRALEAIVSAGSPPRADL